MIGRKKKPILKNSIPDSVHTHSLKENTEKRTDIQIVEKHGKFGIYGTYKENVDLHQLHVMVQQCITDNQQRLRETSDSVLQECREFVENDLGTFLEREEKRETIQNIEKKLEQQEIFIQRYKQDVTPVLKEFSEVPKIKPKDSIHSPEFQHLYHVIQRFISTCRPYIDIQLHIVFQSSTACNCPTPPKTPKILFDGTKICPHCQVEIESYDFNRPTAIPKTTYEEWGNMKKAIAAFQGTNSKSFPEDLFIRLDTFFAEKGGSIGKEKREEEPDAHGKKSGTSRSLMAEALVAIGAKQYAEDIQLIMSLYWGWQLPDLSRHMDEIENLYYQSRPYYNRHRGERKSSLSAQFQLLQILYHMKFDVDISDFKLVMTTDLQRDYNNIWSKVAEDLQWAWLPI